MSIYLQDEEELVLQPPQIPEGELVIKYLQEKKDGATVSELLKHVRLRMSGGQGAAELEKAVETLLETGTALGFLERSGSRTASWTAREACDCCRRRPRRHRSCCHRSRRHCHPSRCRRRRRPRPRLSWPGRRPNPRQR